MKRQRAGQVDGRVLPGGPRAVRRLLAASVSIVLVAAAGLTIDSPNAGAADVVASTCDELWIGVYYNETVQLAGDLGVCPTLEVAPGKSVALDLDGHSLQIAGFEGARGADASAQGNEFGGDGGPGAPGIIVPAGSSLQMTGGTLQVAGGDGGDGGWAMGLWGTGGNAGAGGAAVSGGGPVTLSGGQLSLVGGAGGDGGRAHSYAGYGGDGGASVDAATTTISAGTLTLHGGAGGARGLAQYGGGPGVDSPDVSSGGTLLIESAATLTVPIGTALENSGVIDLAGTVDNAGVIELSGTFSGTGTVVNSGSIKVEETGTVGSSVAVTGHNYALSLSTSPGTVSPTSLQVYSSTVAGAGLGLPIPDFVYGDTLTGWRALGGPLDGTWVADTADLSVSGTNLATSASGPVPVALQAHFSQRIFFTGGGGSYAVGQSSYQSATGGGSGNPVTFSLDASSTGCTINGPIVTFIAVGTCVVNADQAGDATHTAAPTVQRSVPIGLASQAISFTSTAPAFAAPGESYTISATGGGSGNPVTFSLDASSTGCTLSGATVNFIEVGACVIDANQAGDETHAAAPLAQQVIPVRLPQSISFTSTPPNPAAPGESYSVTATGGPSGNPVTFSLDSSSTGCAISGSTVNFTGPGTCRIRASQAGDATYSNAPEVLQQVQVRLPQSFSFTSTPPIKPKVGESYTPTAAGNETANPIVFGLGGSSTGCTINTSTHVVTFTGAGTCVISAYQVGDATYATSPSLQQSIVVPGDQTISFAPTTPDAAGLGESYTISATGGGSGNPVTFSLDGASTGCTISGATVTFAAMGTCVINADQAGNDSFFAAPRVSHSIDIKSAQVISFTSTPPAEQAVGGWYEYATTGGASGQPVRVTLDPSSTGCTLTSVLVTGGVVLEVARFTGDGTCVLNANQDGDATYAPAPQVQQVIAIDIYATRVTGTVTDAGTGFALENVCVSLWDGPAQLRTSCTDYWGNYEMDVVALGTYTLSFVDAGGIYPTLWAGGATTQATSTVVTAGPSEVTVNASMAGEPGSISGNMFFSGQWLTPACAYLYLPGAGGAYTGHATCANEYGNYKFSGIAPGDYVIAYVDPVGLLPTVWSGPNFLGSPTQADATTITVTAGAAVTGVDTHSYPAPGSIRGLIQNPKPTSIDDVGLEGICLYAYGYDPTTGALASSPSAATCTNSMGGYVLSGLSTSGAANYQVAMVDPTGTYPTQWIVSEGWSGSSQGTAPRFRADGYVSMAMDPTPSFYPVMWEGGSISGTVLDASGQPRVGACVYVDYAEDGTYVGQGAVTDANGHYTLTNLAPSTNFGVNPGYKVGFYADCTAGQPPTTHWNGGASSEASAPSIAVSLGADLRVVDTTGVDAKF